MPPNPTPGVGSPDPAAFEPCECPEARYLRELLTLSAVRRRREASWALSAAQDWTAESAAPTFAELAAHRATYATDPLCPEQIHAQASASWCAEARRHRHIAAPPSARDRTKGRP